ncbi:hypothetical protein M747DRAFT_34851 [Aspergillus niger ATCC 13496]|uniref:Uncharacterized protein n=1 Tax=Aspergillus niger ATCC 13496 TaxID=1353008 RepID=A0A370C4N2_ASPNG|nr:hypothetical protein M747DRAFT_34851 [Aspergillus niger ATCC 13496]
MGSLLFFFFCPLAHIHIFYNLECTILMLTTALWLYSLWVYMVANSLAASNCCQLLVNMTHLPSYTVAIHTSVTYGTEYTVSCHTKAFFRSRYLD